jgi:NAD+ kinase
MKKVLIIFRGGSGAEIIRGISSELSRAGANVEIVERDSLTENMFRNAQLAIVVGGDGTFLSAARKNKLTPMFCINPSPESSEGFFARAGPKDTAEKVKRILNGKFDLVNLERLSVTIDGKGLPPALNEVYVGSEKAYRPFRYELILGKREEFQLSSGVLVSTPAGSHAWARSAGGIVLPLSSSKIQYIVREPYSGKIFKARMVRGFSDRVSIIPKDNIYRCVAVLDGMAEFEIKNSDRVLIKRFAHPLKFITF